MIVATNDRMITASHILRVMDEYAERNPQESAALADLRSLIHTGADVTSRKEFRGHVTCGAAVLNPNDRTVLLIHHRALDRWLLPGGHLENQDDSLLDAAMRELNEETGVPQSALRIPKENLGVPIHIDRHTIPANPKKSEPEHEHWDFCFLFFSGESQIQLQLDEVTQWTWDQPSRHSLWLAAILENLVYQD